MKYLIIILIVFGVIFFLKREEKPPQITVDSNDIIWADGVEYIGGIPQQGDSEEIRHR